MEEELNLKAVIGFKGTVPAGLVLHPDNENLVFPLGCTIVVRNVSFCCYFVLSTLLVLIQ